MIWFAKIVIFSIYITEKNIEVICKNWIVKVVVEDLKESLKETTLYRFLIKFLDWLNSKLES